MALKPLADKYLDMPPDEQEALRDWILANVPGAKKAPTKWGAHIGKTPGKLCGPYARGDVIRTIKLFKLWLPWIKETGQYDAYVRELRIVRIKLKMESEGINTDTKKLKRDANKWEAAYLAMGKTLRRQLKITKAYDLDSPKGFFNINSGAQLADALEHADLIDPDDWVYTDKGNRSTSVDNLKAAEVRPAFLKNYAIYSTLSTYINTFLLPWIETGDKANGFIHPTFNQVRTTEEHGNTGTKGTKTGRPSVTNPNFNNLPANVEDSKNRDVLITVAKYLRNFGLNFTGLRNYIVPNNGGIFIGRDYAQQELRVLAHYEDGDLLNLYLDNPTLNIHKLIGAEIYERTGYDLPRKAVKTVVFGTIYGYGLDALAEELDATREDAKIIKRALLKTLPGVSDLDRELKAMARDEEPIRTWGGRLYYCEESKFVKGQYRDFAYKLLNLLIQGSSADITKQAMIQVDDALTDGHIKLQVYDELLANTNNPKRDMPLMREAMEDIKLDCPLPTDGEWSAKSWGQMKKYKD
jgi:DNA polymerase-1